MVEKIEMMVEKKIKIAILTNIIPTYREGFYDHLFSNQTISVTVYCCKEIPNSSLKSIHYKYPNNVQIVKYISLFNGKLIWQNVPFKKIFNSYDVIFIEGNPRDFSHALFATFLRIFKKKVVVWSMVHSYRNNKITESIRLFWLKFFKYHFLYVDSDTIKLKELGFVNKVMIAMNNGLDQKKIERVKNTWNELDLEKWKEEKKFSDKIIILSCSRIDVKKKYDLLIDALPMIIQKIPNLIWCLIGDGIFKQETEYFAKSKGLENNVCFVGALYEEADLAPWFLSSILFVHPGQIGLSILHAFGYGLPVVTHNNGETHSPEYIAFENNLTGRNYIEGNSEDLAKVIIELINNNSELSKMKYYVQKVAREKYNVDIMVDRFLEMVNTIYYSS